MFKYLSLCALSLTMLTLTACVVAPSTNLAMQTGTNQYQVFGIGKDKITAQNQAVRAAQNTCKRGTSPIIIKQNYQYNGVLDEKTGRAVNQAGSIAGIFLGKDINIAQDSDYQVTLDFRCQ